MPADWITAFIDGLHALEERRGIEPLLRQFSPEASLWNIAHREPLRGGDAIRHFWENYRHQFGEIHSHFERIIEQGDEAALEWRAEGTLSGGGTEIAYRGVTLLRRGEAGIVQFASYFDPHPFDARVRVGRTSNGQSTAQGTASQHDRAEDPGVDLEEAVPSVMSYG